MRSTNERANRIWLIVISLMLAAAIGITIRYRSGSRSFDSAVWKRDNFATVIHKSREQATRDRMVDDLLKRFPLVQRTRAEVVSLLGEPDFSKREPFDDWDMIYWLGPDNRGAFGSLDSKWLVLMLDLNHNVAEAKVTFD